MVRLNNDISEIREKELLEKLYNYMGHNIESLNNDMKQDYLTCNNGHDGKDYFWYLDDTKSIAIDMEGNIIDDSNGDRLEGVLYTKDK